MENKLRIVYPSTMINLHNADNVVGTPVYASVWPIPDPSKKWEIIVREIE